MRVSRCCSSRTLSLPGRLALALWAGIGGSVGLLDAVDGFIARRYGPVTVLGKAMDPFGDALYFVVGAIGCCTLGIAPLWLAILVVARYAGPVLLTPLVLLTGRRPELVYTVWGRRNTRAHRHGAVRRCSGSGSSADRSTSWR